MATATLSLLLGVSTLPSNIIAPVPSIQPTLLGVLQGFNSQTLLSGDFWSVVFAFFFVDFFLTNGLLIAVAQ